MGGLLIALKAGAVSFFTKLLGSLLTEKMLAYVFFYFGEKLVESTENEMDNDMLETAKKAYYGEGK